MSPKKWKTPFAPIRNTAITTPSPTARCSPRKLTDDFQAVSHDKHLHVNYSAIKMPEHPKDAKPSPEEVAQERKEIEQMNCGFEKVEHLSGNVGYLKFNFFADPDVCGPTAVAAMNFLGNVDAIIFDLRENGGGDPKMVAFLSTYLFDEPTHLNDLWERKGDVTHQYWTLPYVPGKTSGWQAGLRPHVARHVFRRRRVLLQPEKSEARHAHR